MAVELLPPHRAVHGDPEWYELRRQGVTASEIAVILGLSAWDSPWSLWHRKRGLIDDQADNQDMAWGRRLESAIADTAWERLRGTYPLGQLVAAGLSAHSERRWQMATPDRLIVDRPADDPGGGLVALLEVKHPYSWDGWGDDGTDDVPAAYLAQCLWQLDTLELDECWLAAYSRHSMRIYTIRRDAEGADADLEMMRKRAEEFLALEEPPPLDAHPATLAAVKALHPDLEDRDQEIPDGVAGEYTAACMAMRHAERRKRHAESALRMAMGSARRAFVLDAGQPVDVATRSIYERRSLDSARMRAELPETSAKYTTISTVDRLTPARKDTNEQGL